MLEEDIANENLSNLEINREFYKKKRTKKYFLFLINLNCICISISLIILENIFFLYCILFTLIKSFFLLRLLRYFFIETRIKIKHWKTYTSLLFVFILLTNLLLLVFFMFRMKDHIYLNIIGANSISLEILFLVYLEKKLNKLAKNDIDFLLKTRDLKVIDGKLIDKELIKWGIYPWHKNGIYKNDLELGITKIYGIENEKTKYKKSTVQNIINNEKEPILDNITDNVNTNLNDFIEIELDNKIKQNNTCSICMENLEIFVKTNCNHNFHEYCLRKWYKYKNNTNPDCPLCREKL